jgi:RNA polymerase sigma-70 factor (ECF subfamily)
MPQQKYNYYPQKNIPIAMTSTPNFIDLSDEALVPHCYNSTDAFTVLMERYEKKLFRYIGRIANFSEAENEEILQEVFLKCWQNIRGFSTKLKFSSWIYRITHNLTIDQYRKQKNHQTMSLDEQENLIPKSALQSFDEAFDAKINQHQIAQVLEAIPVKEREILVLFFLEEKSYSEIMDILQVPKSIVANRLARAKQRFAQTAASLAIKFDLE